VSPTDSTVTFTGHATWTYTVTFTSGAQVRVAMTEAAAGKAQRRVGKPKRIALGDGVALGTEVASICRETWPLGVYINAQDTTPRIYGPHGTEPRYMNPLDLWCGVPS